MPGERGTDSGASPWLFLLGLVVFLGSAVLFVADLVRGIDILRSVVGNAVGAVLLIIWAALDTLSTPESEVATRSGAAGTALLLYGVYLLGTGAVIAVTGVFFHDRLVLGGLYVVLSAGAIVLGYLIFPVASVVNENDRTDEPVTDESGDDVTDEST